MTCPKCQQPLAIAQRQQPIISFARKPVSCQQCGAVLRISIRAPQRWWAVLPWVGLAALVLIITVLDRIRVQALAGMPVNPKSLWWFAVLIPLVATVSIWAAIQNYRNTRVTVELADAP